MIIYPPLIETTVPAFTTNTVTLTFSQNPAVSWGEVTGFGLVMKHYTNSNIIDTLFATKANATYNEETKIGTITFTFNENKKPIEKNYYKFQLSYTDDSSIDENSFYAYSVAAIGRCIGSAPTISILGTDTEVLEAKPELNIAAQEFIATYVATLASEPLYSYRFYLKDKDSETIIQDTSVILHNTDNDVVSGVTRTSSHVFQIQRELEYNKQYVIGYETTSINGFNTNNEYYIIKKGRLPIPFEGDIYVGQDAAARENGYVKIVLLGPPCKGEFILERTSDKKEWVRLTTFSLTQLSSLGKADKDDNLLSEGEFVWKDWSVEQGVKYIYAVSQYHNNTYSERKTSAAYMAEFEDMFLSDGEKQLKIKYDPKVSSFKETIPEQKTDTIGSQYPFFFRNGKVRYKEIPISGLISYLSDDDELFMDKRELGLISINDIDEENDAHQATTELIDYNFSAERKFKLSVLEWLNNGKIKLFRSPTEGNYVVRLMNTSLSPNDSLSRLIHTFSSTGYEAGSSDIHNLLDKQLIKIPHIQDPLPNNIVTSINFSDISDWDYNNGQGYRVLWGAKADGSADPNKPKLYPPHIPGTIENIQWYSAKPNTQDTIYLNSSGSELDAQSYVNTTGVFTTPKGTTYDSIVINKPGINNPENYGSSITFSYTPDLTTLQGTDTFAKMIDESTDLIFSAPAGTTLRDGDANTAILTARDDNGNVITDTYENIYKTYVLIARKDDTYIEEGEEFAGQKQKYYLYFYDYNNPTKYETIDCSDGQIRYYYNLSPNVMYEKTKGVHLDIYARLGGTRKSLSSRLGQFVIGSSRLGG